MASECFFSSKAFRWAIAALSLRGEALDGLFLGDMDGESSSSSLIGKRCLPGVCFGVFLGEY